MPNKSPTYLSNNKGDEKMGRKTSNAIMKRILACILTLAIIIPSGMINQQTAYASSPVSPILSATSNRYLIVGDTYDFNIRNKVSGSTYQWKSSNTKVATVNKVGLVTAKKEGTTQISCDIKVNGTKYTLNADVMVVKKPNKPIIQLEIQDKTDYIYAGQTYNLGTTYTPADANDYINWTSSNTAIATVDNKGFVSGIKPGKVTIKATTLSGKVVDSLKLYVGSSAIVKTQKELIEVLSNENITAIFFNSNEEIELTIPEGDYSNKSLNINAPNASIHNNGLFKSIIIEAIKEKTWIEYIKGNIITITAMLGRIVIDKNADTKVHINKSSSDILIEANGNVDITVASSSNVTINGSDSITPNVMISSKGSRIKTNLPLSINTSQAFTLNLNSPAASSTVVKANTSNAIPTLEGSGSITVTVNGQKQTVSTTAQLPVVNTPVNPNPVTPDPVNPDPVNPDPVNPDPVNPDPVNPDPVNPDPVNPDPVNPDPVNPDPVNPDPVNPDPVNPDPVNPDPVNPDPVNPDPVNPKPTQVEATFGSPFVDGEIDSEWANAGVIIPSIYSSPSDVTAEYRLMWDDNALYILAEISDTNLDKVNTASYQQDSLELFLDELYDKASSYQDDDLHYRVNFDNMRSHDNGDKNRFYTKTKITKDESDAVTGYIVEACITWAEFTTPRNNLEMGFDLQINEAKNGSRASSITIFDTTGNSYANPSLFGKIILTGKTETSQSGTNPYKLLAYIDSVNEIYLDAYVNKDTINQPLANAMAIATNPSSTQEQIDTAFDELKAAVNGLNDGSGYPKASGLPLSTFLPDAFTFLDGSSVTNMGDWKLRQEEISKLYQYYMYGVVPDQSDEIISTEYVDSYVQKFVWGSFVWENTVTAGPNQKFVKIKINKNNKNAEFIATATFPSTTTTVDGNQVVTITPPIHDGGYPVLIVIGTLGAAQKTHLNSSGYAVIEFNNGDVAGDNANYTGAFYDIYPYGKTWDQQTGVLLAWGWGVSKIIDVLELDAQSATPTLNISPVNTIVTGVSRNGKAAAVAGAFDSRIKVTAPSCSGAGGMASFRYTSAGKQYDYSMLEKHELIEVDGEAKGTATWENYQTQLHTVGSNESISNLQAAGEGHWFNDNFQGFTSPNQLPFDQHFLAALCATEGRYFYITGEIVGGDWTNPAAMYVSYLAAQNIYDAVGLSDNIAIHLHAVGHQFTLEDTKYLVEFCNKNFYGLTPNMDLNHIKTSIFEMPTNYDPYFDVIKNAPTPNL